MSQYFEFEKFVGKKFKSIQVGEYGDGGEVITFVVSAKEKYEMYHDQDCCEHVYVESISGDLGDITGAHILFAEEVSQPDPNASESGTWTFYKLGTIKGSVTIRWHGSSNGYYSESVSVYKIKS